MTKIGANLFRLLVSVLLLLSYTPAAVPQTLTTGAVQGRVHVVGSPDKGIAKATIVVTNEESGLQRSILTNDSGDYFFGILPPGRYTIAVTAEGYGGRTIPNFAVYNSKTNMVIPPIALQTAAVATSQPPNPTPPKEQRTSVDSGAEQLTNTSNASRGENFDRVMLRTLPLPGIRTFDDLAFLAPGVAPPPQAIGNSVGPGVGAGVGTSGQFAVNGLRSRSNNFTVDGSDNNDEDIGVRRQGFTSLVPQSIESLQEFQITTLLAEPQFGRAMGAQVNAVTRSGSKDLHGNAYVFYTNERLRARDPFDLTGGPSTFPLTRETTFVSDHAPILLNGNPVAPFNPVGGENPFGRTQYGFTLGGPLHQPDALFFVSFEHQKVSGSKESNFAVPTIAQRGFLDTGEVGGIFCCDSQGKIILPVFPTSSEGDAFFSFFPFPNNPRGPYGRNTFTDLLPTDAEGSIFSIRLDQQNIKALGTDHTLTGRYNFTDDDTILPVTGEALFSSLRPLVRTQNLSVILNSSISSRITNQGRFSWGRTSLAFQEVRNGFLTPSRLPNAPPFLLNTAVRFNATLPIIQGGGLIGFNPTSYESGQFTTEDIIGPIGQVIVSGFSPVGVDVFNFPQQRTNNTYQYADTIIYNFRKQRFTAGVDIRNVKLKSQLERNSRPLVTFSAAENTAGGGKKNPNPFSRLLTGNTLLAAGAPTGFFQSITSANDPSITLRDWQTNLFLTDQIRIRSNLSLTLGLRYENNSVPTEDQRRIEDTFNSQAVFKFEKLERDLTGTSGLERLLDGRSKIFRRDNNNIGPHVAFAWDLFGDGKTAVRAGYGIYYDQIPGAVINQSRNVFPTVLTTNIAGTQFVVDPNTPLVLLPPNLARLRFANNPNGPFETVIVSGTLNRLNSGFVQNVLGGDISQVLPFLRNFSDVGGLAFVLPSASLETPYAQHWGLTVEQQVMRDLIVSLGYVGTKGTHLLRFATPNLGPNAIPALRNITTVTNPSNREFFEVPLAVGNLSPPRGGRPFPLLGSVTTIESDANSIYHALQVQVIKRFSHGLQLTTAYTWSHAIDEVSDIFDLAGAPALPQNSFDRRAERGDANFDVRHRVVSSFIWELPIFEQNKYLGGWELAGIGTFSSGQPYTILAGLDVNQDGNLTDRLSDTSSIAQVHDGASRFTFNGNLNQFVTGQDGAVGRNTFRAQGTSLVNLALNKHFRFNERHDVEFRSEFFNVFNRTHFGIPINQLGFPGFGNSVNTRVPNRTLQLALKYSF